MTATRIPPARIRPASESITPADFRETEKEGWPIPDCRQCGVSLNVSHVGDERDGFALQDRVPVGVGDVWQWRIGGVFWCRACVSDAPKMAARLRRLKKTKGLNYVD